jgi:hypothetical protein
MYVALSLVVGIGLLLEVFPWHPKRMWEWSVLFGGALPIGATGEWLGHLVLENSFARRLGSRGVPRGLSSGRVAYGVIAVSGFTMLVGVGLSLFSRGW